MYSSVDLKEEERIRIRMGRAYNESYCEGQARDVCDTLTCLGVFQVYEFMAMRNVAMELLRRPAF